MLASETRSLRVTLTLGSGLLLAALAGCDSNVEEKIALAKLAQTCLVNSDCSAPLVCAFEACHTECESSRDCEAGARCVAAARPYKVCQLEEERACARTSDCAEGLVCGIDGECRDRCLTDNDCVEDQRCVSGTCADTNELNDAGRLEPAPGKEQGAEGSPCVYVSDCSGALLCRGQACLPQCKADRDCAAHELCQDTRCVPDGSEPLACSYHSQCATERGERCLGGACHCLCVEDRDCPGGQTCNGCGCEPSPEAPQSCVYNSDCDAPGQICKNRSCACECRADLDCGAGARCDGCGCVREDRPVDGVISGNVTIDSALQLPQYRGATEIYGDLVINGSSLDDLGDAFDQLRLVGGRVMLNESQLLTRISFPKLEQAQLVSLSYVPKVEVVELPALRTATVDINSAVQLRTLDLRSFESGSFLSYGLGHLKKLTLPALTELGSLQVTDALELVELDLPELTQLRGILAISAGSPGVLALLSAPKLARLGVGQEAGYLHFDHTALKSLAAFGAADWEVHATALQAQDNTAMGRCALDAFLARLSAGGFTGDVTRAGEIPCTDCQGETCAD